MKTYLLIIILATTILFSCTKEEGEGGRASITGKIHMTDDTGGNQGSYYVPDYDVYIIYGDKDNIYDDDTKTNYDGSYQFTSLREGSYRIFAYSTDASEDSGKSHIIKSVEITSAEETVTVGDIEVIK